MTWTAQPGEKPSNVLRSAVDDTQAERYEDALQKFLWFHEASRSERGMGGVRLSFVLGYWLDLATKFPPALDAFADVRNELEQRCRDNHGDFETFHDASAFNRYLGDNRRTVERSFLKRGNQPLRLGYRSRSFFRNLRLRVNRVPSSPR